MQFLCAPTKTSLAAASAAAFGSAFPFGSFGFSTSAMLLHVRLGSAVSCAVRNVSLTIIMSKIVVGFFPFRFSPAAQSQLLTVTRVFMVIQVSLISRSMSHPKKKNKNIINHSGKWVKIELGALIAKRLELELELQLLP